MCGPAIAIIGFAVSALGAVAQFAAQKKAADAQNARWRQNYVNALASARDDQNQLTLRQEQEQDASAQKVRASQLDAAERGAEVTNAAASSGVAGISLDNLVTEVNRKAAENQVTAMKNYEMTAAQLQKEKDATNNTALSRINSVPKGEEPSGLSLFTNIAGAGVKAFGSMAGAAA